MSRLIMAPALVDGRTKPKTSSYVHGHSSNVSLRYAHAKLDGHFMRVTRDPVNGVRAFTSKPLEITGQLPERLLANLVRYGPPTCELWGELYAEGMRSSEVKTALIERADRLQFSVFAVPSMPHDEPLENVEDAVTKCGLRFAEYELLRTGWDGAAIMRRFASEGYEGCVFKHANLSDWRKAKPELTADLIITGAQDGRGKFLGLVGSVECSVVSADGRLRVVADAGGFDDATRAALTDAWLEESLIGRVVEVKYQYVGSRGRLRHPRFVRLRDDKSASECDGTDIDFSDIKQEDEQ